MNALSAGKYWGLRRLADEGGHFNMLAVDQRPPIKQIVSQRRGEDTPRYQDIRDVKRTMMEVLAPYSSAVLVDPTYALMDAMKILSPHHGLVITLEDSIFTETQNGRCSKQIDDWTVGKIKRAGGDAVKVLTWYQPDQSEKTRNHQKDFTRKIGQACAEHDIPFLLEFLTYPLQNEQDHLSNYVEHQDKHAEDVIKTVEEFSGDDFGIDIFKLESPIAAADVPDPNGDPDAVGRCMNYFHELGKACNRPWVMLSAGATKPAFKNVLHYALEAGASGFLAGRAIWWDDFQAFPDLAAMKAGMEKNAVPYMQSLCQMTAERGLPWNQHPVYADAPGPAGFSESNFASWYSS